ncbi:MAG: hypothetical protein BGO01_12375 [Armatimonadetes bacterium 55-13]|nr:Fic family protein [Armatimonadota bacterium]OJU61709.1 MAG: hypothetical protein BGO01_12375 [Armatimonadetes bacterium 55-13]
MSESTEVHIWNPQTGIQDLPADWNSLSVPSVKDVQTEWANLLNSSKGQGEIQEFNERLHREWAIETGIIENLYDIERGVTLTLIEQGFSAAVMEHGSVNRDREYILALLNDQKDALEGLFAFVKQDQPLSTSYIKSLHAAMTRSQTTVEAFDPEGNKIQVPLLHGDWKKQSNYPRRGDHVYMYCPPEQTASEMDRLVQMHHEHLGKGVSPEVEAAWLHHRFTQIHPFQDGNGRVARALASLVLIRAGLFPFLVPRDEKEIYLESLELADQGDLRSLTISIARGQQISIRRAKSLGAKLAPPSNSLQEAISRIELALSESSESQAARRKRAARFLAEALQEPFRESIGEVIKRISNTHPGITSSSTSIQEQEQFPQSLLNALSKQLGYLPLSPSFCIEVSTTFPLNPVLYLYCYGVSDPLQDIVEASLLLGINSEWRLISPEPFRLNGAAVNITSAKEWLETSITVMLDLIRADL